MSNNSPKKISTRVRLYAKKYRQFCRFDNFQRQRRWFAPLLTCMILLTFSAAYMLISKNPSSTAAGLLAGLGLAVPLFCFGLYIIQIEAQIAGMKLGDEPEIYALEFDNDGVHAAGTGQARSGVDLPWNSFWAAFRRKDCTYLYFTQERAFILPDGQADVSGSDLFVYLASHMEKGRCIDEKGKIFDPLSKNT